MMIRPGPSGFAAAAITPLAVLWVTAALAGFSVDEDPREVPLDPGDLFLAGATCEVDDGDGSCSVPPSLRVPSPTDFDLDAFSIEEALPVCPAPSPFPPGILFSMDDGEPGPGVGPPDNATEVFFYDHCLALGARRSYHTSLGEVLLGLGSDPPPSFLDDDVDALETRAVAPAWLAGTNLLFSADAPSTGGLLEGNVYFISSLSLAPGVWATPTSLGVPDPHVCDIDGIAVIQEPFDPGARLLFTTDLLAPCGLDPGDIYVSDNLGSLALYADDVTDLKIAVGEDDPVDVDALAVNTSGAFDILEPYEPPAGSGPVVFKAGWPNYAPSGMPDFSQDHLGFPDTWCGPTALSDSLWWFDSELECDSDRLRGQDAESEPNDACTDADILGEVPPLSGGFSSDADSDWYTFQIPGGARTCTVTVSTCSLREAGDADTVISLYDGCAPSTTPGALIASNDNACSPALQSEVVAKVPAGERYFVQVEPGPSGVATGGYTLTLGIDCYPLVERSPETAALRGTPDDHSEHQPARLIPQLAACMNTDDVLGTGSGHRGTRIADMQDCIDQWLVDKRLEESFREQTLVAPPFVDVAAGVVRSHDVIVLLGFYWQDSLSGIWIRCGGHYVTAAGVDPLHQILAVSDPGRNNAEPPPVGNGAPGRVPGPDHSDHAPAVMPPPDHDDARNASHDAYAAGPSQLGSPLSLWSLPAYATFGGLTTCADVERWCMGPGSGQNPPPVASPVVQLPCPDPTFRVSAEVEAVVDVSPTQTPVCMHFDSDVAWPENVRLRKGGCLSSAETVDYDVIRGKACNIRMSNSGLEVDLGHVTCLFDDAPFNEFPDLSPDDTGCLGYWFYLLRESGDPDYGTTHPGGQPRLPSSGGCP